MSKRKAPSKEDNLNADFCDFLIELAEYERNANKNVHKYNAYRKAASVLAVHPKRIESGDEARKLNGIGDKISKKIDEFLTTGKLRKLENIHNDDEYKSISLFSRVTGIGPVKAKELVKSGLKTLEDLERNQSKLTHHQILGLKYFEDFEKRIPREEIQLIEEKLKGLISHVDDKFTITICGSYRRGKSESGDIDMLLTHPSYTSSKKDQKHLLKDIVCKLEESDLITDTLSLGDTKFMGVCRLEDDLPARRIDIRLTPFDQYHCAVLYFTGSDIFNKTMRAHALEHKFTLNEYSLRPMGVTGVPGESIPITSEEDIFDYIDYPYKKPEERDM